MQIRVLATAANSGKAWDLRCEIREKVIEFIQQKYPQQLPQIGADFATAVRSPIFSQETKRNAQLPRD